MEIEAEQLRLADAEEYEKAAELSAERSRLHGESEDAARRLGVLEDEESSLELAFSECRQKLLCAVQDEAASLIQFQKQQVQSSAV